MFVSRYQVHELELLSFKRLNEMLKSFQAGNSVCMLQSSEVLASNASIPLSDPGTQHPDGGPTTRRRRQGGLGARHTAPNAWSACSH